MGKRKSGVARLLMDEMEASAQRLGVRHLSDWTRDPEQRSFYAHFGFQVGVGRAGLVEKFLPLTREHLLARLRS